MELIYSRSEVGAFKALRLTPKQKEVVKADYLPLCLGGNESEVFVYGYGHYKVNPKRIVEVEAFTDDTDFYAYLDKYGKYVLYYALYGESYNPTNCSSREHRQEFEMLTAHKLDNYGTYVSAIKKLWERQREVLKNYYFVRQEDDYLFKPLLDVRFCNYPTMDSVADDGKMESLFVSDRFRVYRKTHEKKPLYDKMYSEKEPNTFSEELHHLLFEIAKDALSSAYDDLNNGTFPVSVKDRIAYIFGNDAADLYETALSLYNEKE